MIITNTYLNETQLFFTAVEEINPKPTLIERFILRRLLKRGWSCTYVDPENVGHETSYFFHELPKEEWEHKYAFVLKAPYRRTKICR